MLYQMSSLCYPNHLSVEPKSNEKSIHLGNSVFSFKNKKDNASRWNITVTINYYEI